MFFVYILKSSKDCKYYIGSTENLERRLEEHNRGKTLSTKNRAPFCVVYYEVFYTKIEAINRERQIKKYKGGQAFKNLFKKDAFDPIVQPG